MILLCFLLQIKLDALIYVIQIKLDAKDVESSTDFERFCDADHNKLDRSWWELFNIFFFILILIYLAFYYKLILLKKIYVLYIYILYISEESNKK